MRCPKCGLLHGGLGKHYKGIVYPYTAYVCETPGCGHDWMVKHEVPITPDSLSLEERVELLERLVARLQREDHSLPIPHPYLVGELHKKYAQECIDKAKGGEE